MSEQETTADLHEARQQVSAESVERAHEVHDINLRAILLFGLALAIMIVLSIILLLWMLDKWSGRRLAPDAQIVPALVTPVPVPGPALQAVPALDLQQVLAPQQERLNSYGWVDQNAGIVHVPITQAMQLLLAEGLPSQNVDPPNFQLSPAYNLESRGGQ